MEMLRIDKEKPIKDALLLFLEGMRAAGSTLTCDPDEVCIFVHNPPLDVTVPSIVGHNFTFKFSTSPTGQLYLTLTTDRKSTGLLLSAFISEMFYDL